MTSQFETHTFVLKMADKPGAMELVAATFAHRGISLSSMLGADGTFSESGHGKVLVTFSATPAKKEVVRRALQRLSRVHSLVEYPFDSPLLRKTAFLHLAAGAPAPVLPDEGAGLVERVALDVETGEVTYLVVGTAAVVDAILEELCAAGCVRDVTQTILAL